MNLAVEFNPLPIPMSFIDVTSDGNDTVIIAKSPISGYGLGLIADEIGIWKENFGRLQNKIDGGFVVKGATDVTKQSRNSTYYDREDIYDL
jgi:hypothetical protein